MRTSRRLVLSAAALGLALAASGCAYFNPVQTHEFYQAADGTNANLPQDGSTVIGVRNALVILREDGTAEFSATVVNYEQAIEGAEPTRTVDLAAATSDGTAIFATGVSLAPEQVVSLGAGEDSDQSVQIGDASGVVAGDILDLTVTSGDQTVVISVPVVDGSLEHYSETESGENAGA